MCHGWLLASALLLAGPAFEADGRSEQDTPAGKQTHGVVLTWHHVASDTPPSTSVTPEVFVAHLDALAQADAHVMSLATMIETIRSGRLLPQRAVALTFDDAYRSVFETALPLLEARRWPFTIFVNTAAIDAGGRLHMTWNELAEALSRGAEVGNHSHTHPHLVRRQAGESTASWAERVSGEIDEAQARFKQRLGVTPALFAYPYGEFNEAVTELVAARDMIGIGQQSGAIGPVSDFLALPRFPLGGRYADVDRVRTALSARPLPVSWAAMTAGDVLEFRVDEGPFRLGELACYVTGSGKAQLQRDGDVWRATPASPLRPGRNKFNCTAPGEGGYFWWSFLQLTRHADGRWYEEPQ